MKEPYDVATKYEFNKWIKEINDINEEIVKTLQSQDGAFSIGMANDNLKGVKLGMVNEVDAVEKLAEQIQMTGKTIEESAIYLEKMTQIVRASIHKANNDLKKENDEKMQEQGVMRQIPFVNELFNWIAPISNKKIPGRSLNLDSGKVDTTEVFYASKMQVKSKKEDNNGIYNDALSLNNDTSPLSSLADIQIH